MRKLKNCSFYFLIKNLIFTLFVSAIFYSGFFVFNVFAEEDITEGNNFTLITEDIVEDTTWSKENSPYVISNSILISNGATLFIEPGVVIKFDADNSNTSIYVSGKIIADGSVDNPIYFTSNYDDMEISTDIDYEFCDYINFNEWGEPIGEEVCEIIDMDEPNIGDWGGLYFINSSGSEVNNTFLKFAEGAIYIESSSINFENLNISDSRIGVVGGAKSNIKITGANLSNLEEAFTVYDDSFLDIEKTEIKNVSYGFTSYISDSYKNKNLDFILFDNSILKIRNLNLECSRDGLTVFNNYNLDIKDSHINCSNDGLVLFNNVTVDMEGVKINNAVDAGIIAFNNTADLSYINITKGDITENSYGFVVWDSKMSVHNSSIHNNLLGGVLTFTSAENPMVIDLDFKNNWWGDKTGPSHSLNAMGLGDTISDHILYDPWLLYDPLIERRDPVILIPGITGSYLIKDYGDKEEIWPNASKLILSMRDISLRELSLDKGGNEIAEYPILLGDIVRGINLPIVKEMHVFDLLIKKLKDEGYEEGKDLFVFPYDWRFSTNNSAQLLNEKVNTIILNQEYNKVDIVAHSMGGLIAKKYIKDYGEEKVDQLIFLGTPQLGSPKAFKALMYGDSMGYEKFGISFLKPSITKFISQNMPSVYELLPSKKYLNLNGSYVIDAMTELIDLPIFNLDYSQTKNFMIKNGRNSSMFSFAENLHDSIDDLNLSSIKSYNFIGCGSATIGNIKSGQEMAWYKLFLETKNDYEIEYIDGDETVPLISARETIGSEKFYVKGVSHGSLPASINIINNIISLLKGEDVTTDKTLQKNDEFCGIEGEVVSTHSPVSLHIYDEDGNHTGIDENGDVEYGVEGVSFDVLDDVNYAFLPEDNNFKIVIKAEDTGGYDLQIDTQEGDNITETKNWTMVPIRSLESISELTKNEEGDYILSVDDEGDGEVNETYEESFDGTEEAKKITKVAESRSRHFGRYLVNVLNTINNPVVIGVNNNTEQLNIKNTSEQSADTQKNSNNDEHIDIEDLEEIKDVIDEEDLLASAGMASTKQNLIFQAMLLFGVVFILLAKMFIKL